MIHDAPLKEVVALIVLPVVQLLYSRSLTDDLAGNFQGRPIPPAMHVLCSTGAVSRERIPEQHTLAGIPLTAYWDIIDYVIEVELLPALCDHCCDIQSPCLVFRRTIQQCRTLLAVCRHWNAFATELLRNTRYSLLQTPPRHQRDWSYSSSWTVASNFSLAGRYRGYKVIEEEYGKCVLQAYDYGGPRGCHGKTEVIIKVSNARNQHENELEVYSWLSSPRDIPKLYYNGEYGPGLGYYGLVLSKLGPDLDRLRMDCRHKRFTPRLTLAVAIQTIRIYERFHAQGWLHCNAKLGNFAIGPNLPGQNNRIFMLDFEHASHIEPTPCTRTSCTGWNALFKPVTWEMRLTPSRRDDLEGLGYVFSYLERGSHPWEHLSADEIWRFKICTPTIKLFEGMDSVYINYFNHVKALAWGEIPDYGGIIQQFCEVWERKGYGGTPGEIDWWDELGIRTSSE